MAIATINPRPARPSSTFDAARRATRSSGGSRARDAAFRTRCAPRPSPQRAEWMRAAADLLEADVDAVADDHDPRDGQAARPAPAPRLLKCAKGMRFYADHAEEFLADEPLADPSSVDASRAYARYQPLGVVLAVMPWNYPLWQVIRFAAPALMAGNVGLLKHASNVPQSALYLDTLFTRGGFPEGAFTTLLIGSARGRGRHRGLAGARPSRSPARSRRAARSPRSPPRRSRRPCSSSAGPTRSS